MESGGDNNQDGRSIETEPSEAVRLSRELCHERHFIELQGK